MEKQPLIKLEPLFPRFYARAKIDRKFTKREFHFVENQILDYNETLEKYYSKSRNILDDKRMRGIRNFINEALDACLKKALTPKNRTSIYVTQSWLNYINEGMGHQSHYHDNSFYSGILYIQVNENDGINFHKRREEPLTVISEKYHMYNSASWFTPVEQGDLIIFPSHMSHSVNKSTSQKTRISLSFNTFVSGHWGDRTSLTHLKL